MKNYRKSGEILLSINQKGDCNAILDENCFRGASYYYQTYQSPDHSYYLPRNHTKITGYNHELWLHRIKKCPDPDHIGGRIRCASCDNIETQQVS